MPTAIQITRVRSDSESSVERDSLSTRLGLEESSESQRKSSTFLAHPMDERKVAAPLGESSDSEYYSALEEEEVEEVKEVKEVEEEVEKDDRYRNVSYYQLFSHNLRRSRILTCSFDGMALHMPKLSARGILVEVLKKIKSSSSTVSQRCKLKKSMDEIFENFSFNYTSEKMDRLGGYCWNKDLEISFQSKGIPETIEEIIRLCHIYCWSIDMEIQLAESDPNKICILHYSNSI